METIDVVEVEPAPSTVMYLGVLVVVMILFILHVDTVPQVAILSVEILLFFIIFHWRALSLADFA